MKIFFLLISIFSFSLSVEVPNDVKPLLPGMTIPEINVLNVNGEMVSIVVGKIKKLMGKELCSGINN